MRFRVPLERASRNRWPGQADSNLREAVMDTAITALTVVAALVFSVAVGIMAEEVIFGEIFRLLFAERAVQRVGSGTKSR